MGRCKSLCFLIVPDAQNRRRRRRRRQCSVTTIPFCAEQSKADLSPSMCAVHHRFQALVLPFAICHLPFANDRRAAAASSAAVFTAFLRNSF